MVSSIPIQHEEYYLVLFLCLHHKNILFQILPGEKHG